MQQLKKRILVSITGKTARELKNKIGEINKLKIKRAALFITFLSEFEQRKKVYEALLDSGIKKIPLVHIRDEVEKDELEFLIKNFRTEYFNIHKKSFRNLKKWKGFYKKLLVELHYRNQVPKNSEMEKVGGFCIDLSHLKSAQMRNKKEFDYVLSKKKLKKKFRANHLNGYSEKRKEDLHNVKSLKEFNYLKTIPKFVFGKYIALETFNSIHEQLELKKYLCKFLKNY